MVKIGDIVKVEPVFPDSEVVKGENVIGKSLNILAFGTREGLNGKFLVVLAKAGSKKISFSVGASVVVEKLIKIQKHYNIEANPEGIVIFPEPVETTMIEVKSKKTGLNYYDLE